MTDPAATRVDAGPGAPGPWIDNHCHVVGEPPEVLEAARGAGVVAAITVGTDGPSSLACLELAAATDGLWATAGLHPHDASAGTGELRAVLSEWSGTPELVAIGECGLDHHYDHSPPAAQREVFTEQIALAHELELPLVIHTREAWDETFQILEVEGVPPRTVFHCFTGGPDEAARCVELGALLSISGIVTFPGAAELQRAVAATPLDRLMVETDSPYLAPVPKRGRRNEPANVAHVGAQVAQLHGVEVAEVAARTTATASRFYGLGIA
ncbi:MAG: TatD family hydrolase [Microthrixaceae bacterium]